VLALRVLEQLYAVGQVQRAAEPVDRETGLRLRAGEPAPARRGLGGMGERCAMAGQGDDRREEEASDP